MAIESRATPAPSAHCPTCGLDGEGHQRVADLGETA